MKKKWFTVLLALGFAVSLAVPVSAEAGLGGGGQGTKNNPWDISAPGSSVVAYLETNEDDPAKPTYTLVISGEGMMAELDVTGVTAEIEQKAIEEHVYDPLPTDTRPWKDSLMDITRMVVENGVTNVGKRAMKLATNLKSLTLADSVKTIGMQTFHTCTGLESVDGLDKVAEIQRSGFEHTALRQVDLSGLETLGENAFLKCTNLTGAIFGDSISAVGNGAFQLSGLTKIELPDSINSLGTAVFYMCKDLAYAKLPAHIQEIPNQTFQFCNNLATIALPANYLTIGQHAFNSTQLAGLLLPAGITEIAEKAFAGLPQNSVLYTREKKAAELLSSENYDSAKTAIGILDGGAFAGDIVFQAGTLAAPAKEGHTFGGWYENSDCSGEAVTSAEAGHTYYAKWTPNTYTIQFEGGEGAAGTMEALNATYGQPATLPASGFTKLGSDFMGWDTDAGADTVVYADGAQVENLTMEAGGTVTLYAVWKAQTPTVPDTAIALDKTELSLEPGQTAKLKASLTPADATYKYIFWTSSAEAVATVSDSGVVTAMADGTATITAKSWYGNEAVCTVTVKTPDEPTPPELVDPWPTEGLAGFVTRCYRVALGRDPDKAGHADWVRWLQEGTVDATSCTYGFVFSKEMNSKNLSDEAFVKTLYSLFMDREGETTGVAFWTSYLQDGHSREEVFYGFADSVEFARLKAGYGIA